MSGDIPELRRNRQVYESDDEDLDVSGEPQATMYANAFQDFETGRHQPNYVQLGSPDGPSIPNFYALDAQVYDSSGRPYDLEEYYNDAVSLGLDVDLIIGRNVYTIVQRRPETMRRSTRRERRRVASLVSPVVRNNGQHYQPSSQPWSTAFLPRTSFLAEGSGRPQVSENRKFVTAKRYQTCGTHSMTWPPPPPPPPAGRV